MKKILIISAVFPPEPVVSAMLSKDLAEALSEENDVIVISPPPTRPLHYKFHREETPQPPKYTHIIANSFTCPESKILGRMKESYSFGKFCAKYIEKEQDKIEVIYQNTWPLLGQLFVSQKAKQFKIPLITHVMDIYPESLISKLPFFKNLVFRMFLPIDKKILNRSERIICISDKMKNTLSESRNIDKKRFQVVLNWQNEENFLKYKQKKGQNTSEKKDHFTFMYLGNNGPVAGVEFLIETFYKANIPDSRLVIAGGGSKTDDCKNLVDRLQTKNIDFISVPEGKVPEIQDMADVMLLPVKKNGAYSSIPSKLPAYMFSSKPIIGSLDTDSDTAKAIIDAECGLVVEPENEIELMKAMREMVSWGQSVLTQSGENGFNYSIKNFSKKENLKKIVDIINSVS